MGNFPHLTNPLSIKNPSTRLGWGPGGSVAKNLPASAGDVGLIPGAGWSPGEGNGNPLQYSCLGNPMDRGAGRLQSTGSQKSQMRLTKQQDWDLNTTHSVIQLSQIGLKWDSFSCSYNPMSHKTASCLKKKKSTYLTIVIERSFFGPSWDHKLASQGQCKKTAKDDWCDICGLSLHIVIFQAHIL